MATRKKSGKKRLTNERMFHLLMNEMVDIRNELKMDIQNLDRRLSGEINRLSKRVDVIAIDLKSLRLEVHQNHLSFMKNHDDIEKPMTVVEA